MAMVGGLPSAGGQAQPPLLGRGAACLDGHAAHLASAACGEEDLRLLEGLREEISRTIRPFSGQWRTFTTESGEECRAPWRNGMGSESAEELEGKGFPAQASVLRKLSQELNVEMLLWWINVYEDGSVGCEFHHDGHGMINNITVGASFGATRNLTFKHHITGHEISFPQKNGDIFAFDDFVDSNYMHGLHPVKEETGQRVSVIIMGRRRTQALWHQVNRIFNRSVYKLLDRFPHGDKEAIFRIGSTMKSCCHSLSEHETATIQVTVEPHMARSKSSHRSLLRLVCLAAKPFVELFGHYRHE